MGSPGNQHCVNCIGTLPLTVVQFDPATRHRRDSFVVGSDERCESGAGVIAAVIVATCDYATHRRRQRPSIARTLPAQRSFAFNSSDAARVRNFREFLRPTAGMIVERTNTEGPAAHFYRATPC